MPRTSFPSPASPGRGLAAFTMQPLPGGNILLVGPSPQRRPEILPRNAVVYDAGGHVLAEEALGDGIQHVLADSTGAVWVGYSDEGVFGDDPLGACGLIRFTPDLTPAWRYPSDDNPFGPIDDCEALNVDGATAWTCYDSGYPIVRIDEGILTRLAQPRHRSQGARGRRLPGRLVQRLRLGPRPARGRPAPKRRFPGHRRVPACPAKPGGPARLDGSHRPGTMPAPPHRR